MNFKEALIAHLQGEKVEVRSKGEKVWESFLKRAGFVKLEQVNDEWGRGCEFRLARRTIRVNGVEVPAPERVAPIIGACYYVPDPKADAFCSESTWADQVLDNSCLTRGLVYLRKEDAIERAKAMLIAKEV